MSNDFDTPAWADHHRDLSDAIRRGLRAIATGLERLHRIQWAAPWQHSTTQRLRRGV